MCACTFCMCVVMYVCVYQVVTIDSSPAVISELNDGAVPGVDQRYVTVNDTIAANWNANDRQSGVAWYEITVNQLQNGNRMQVSMHTDMST